MSAGRITQFVRTFMTSGVRRSGGHHDEGGIPGANLPFSLNNPYKLTLLYILFFGSAFGAPFLIVRHQLLKK